jgi:hypothetical protein
MPSPDPAPYPSPMPSPSPAPGHTPEDDIIDKINDGWNHPDGTRGSSIDHHGGDLLADAGDVDDGMSHVDDGYDDGLDIG